MQLIHDDYDETFEKHLQRHKSFRVHKNSIQQLAINSFEIKDDIAYKVFKNMFCYKQ